MKIIRQFDVFDKVIEALIDEIPIPDFDLEAVKSIIKADNDPLLYYQYDIEGDLKLYFENLGYHFDTDKYLYSLCCFQDT